MGAGDGVLGHFSVLNGKSYQALLPESSPLFCAVVSDNCELLETELSADPGIALRVYNVLEWSSDGSKPEQGTDSSSITVKVRTLLHVAALAGAQGVAQLLLSRGADPLAKSSDGQTPVSLARLGEEKPALVAMLQDAAALANNSSPGANSSTAGVSSGVAMEVLATLQATSLKPDAATPAGYSMELAGVRGGNQEHELDAYNQAGFSTAELTDPAYSTDEFRMFAFKVLRCSKRFAHDWRACPFAHPTENARRRDPREIRYCAIACPDYKQGFCVRGDLCPYAHGVFECWLHPSRFRTQLCKDGANCHRPICFFAHSLNELRTPTHTWTPTGSDDSTLRSNSSGLNNSAPGVAGAGGNGNGNQTPGQHAGGGGTSNGSSSQDMGGMLVNSKTSMSSSSDGAPSNNNNNGVMAAPAAARGYANGMAAAHLAPAPASAAMLPAPHSGSHHEPRGANAGDPGMLAATAAGNMPPIHPSTAAAAMFGFTAPRMSNAFARRHGLNPKDNAMLNLQKIALQAQLEPSSNANMMAMRTGSAASGQSMNNGMSGMPGASGLMNGGPPGGMPPPYMSGPNNGHNGRGYGQGPAHRKHNPGGYNGMGRAALGHAQLAGGYSMHPGGPGPGLAAMHAAAAAAMGHDPAAMAALNNQLAVLSMGGHGSGGAPGNPALYGSLAFPGPGPMYQGPADAGLAR